MKMHRIGLLAFTLTSVVALASANAADMYRAPEPIASGYKDDLVVQSWAGFYVGVNGGGAWGKTEATDRLATNHLPWVKNGAKFSTNADGAVGGGTIGYNWQRSNFVFGVEGDVGYLGLKGSGNYNLLPTTKLETDGGVSVSARGRLGYAFGSTMVYGTGGYFGADLDSRVHQDTGVLIRTTTPGFQSGWAAGGGVEHMINPAWSLKVEYLHFDLGTDRVGGICCGGGVTQFFDIKNEGDIVRGGVNYHFGSAYTPLK